MKDVGERTRPRRTRSPGDAEWQRGKRAGSQKRNARKKQYSRSLQKRKRFGAIRKGRSLLGGKKKNRFKASIEKAALGMLSKKRLALEMHEKKEENNNNGTI